MKKSSHEEKKKYQQIGETWFHTFFLKQLLSYAFCNTIYPQTLASWMHMSTLLAAINDSLYTDNTHETENMTAPRG